MVESEVQALFPGKRVARVDADVSASDSHQNKVRKIIEAFGEGKIDILLGTQMVAKGLNFPGVELVGIVLADSGLNIPDFRAEERTFALLTQVSGRAGRYNDKGRVVIQTFHPENAAIVAAQRGDLKAFYATELANREMTGFPPYSRLVNLVLRGRKEETVVAACATLGDLVRSLDPDGAVEVMCNDACAIERKGDYFRHHILLRSLRPGKLQAVVARALGLFKVPSGIYVEVDIDPMQML
jgi:primosomal protein N' (replication factor Y)